MAKLVVVFTALIILVLAAHSVSAYRTIVTVTVDESECKERIRKGEMEQCERFLEHSSGEERAMVMMRRSELKMCCEQLQRVDRECQCEAFVRVVEEHQQKRGREGQVKELERIVLSECGLLRCEIPTPLQMLRSKTFRF